MKHRILAYLLTGLVLVVFSAPAIRAEWDPASDPELVKAAGETVKAFIVLRPGASASGEEIVEFSRLHLAAFKVPRKVEFRSELPKSMVGKYLRRVLVEEERPPESSRGY